MGHQGSIPKGHNELNSVWVPRQDFSRYRLPKYGVPDPVPTPDKIQVGVKEKLRGCA